MPSAIQPPASATQPAPDDYGFSPREEAQVFEHFCDPRSSLATIANRHGTQLEFLALWSQSPSIKPKVEAIRALARLRADIISCDNAAKAVWTLDALTHYLQNPAAKKSKENFLLSSACPEAVP